MDVLLPTYNDQRRQHAVRVIEISGTYLRFVCGSDLHVPDLRNVEALNDKTGNDENVSVANGNANGDKVNGHVGNGKGAHIEFDKDNKLASKLSSDTPQEAQNETDLDFLANFFKTNGQFLLGVDCPYGPSVIRLEITSSAPLRAKPGVRAPNPRICFGTGETGYPYDKLGGAASGSTSSCSGRLSAGGRYRANCAPSPTRYKTPCSSTGALGARRCSTSCLSPSSCRSGCRR